MEPIQGAGSRRHARLGLGGAGQGRGPRAHLTPPALALLAKLLLHLFVQTPHLPLVLALPPSGDRR